MPIIKVIVITTTEHPLSWTRIVRQNLCKHASSLLPRAACSLFHCECVACRSTRCWPMTVQQRCLDSFSTVVITVYTSANWPYHCKWFKQMLLVWAIVLERAKSSIFPKGNCREFFSLAGVLLRFQKGNSRRPCLPRISGNWNDNYGDLITSCRLYVIFPEISENFQIISGILHFRKFRNPSAYMIP